MLGVPRFDTAVLRTEGGTFTVRALRSGPEDRYVRAVRLNGRAWPLTYVRHADLAAGGSLDFEMGPEPDLQWGRDRWSRPPSDSDPADVVQSRARAEAAARR